MLRATMLACSIGLSASLPVFSTSTDTDTQDYCKATTVGGLGTCKPCSTDDDCDGSKWSCQKQVACAYDASGGAINCGDERCPAPPLAYCDSVVDKSPPDGTDCKLKEDVGCYDNTDDGKYYLECDGTAYCRKAGTSWGNDHIQAGWKCTLKSNGPPKPSPPSPPPSPPASPSPPPSPPAPPSSPRATQTNSIFCNPNNANALSCSNILKDIDQINGYVVDFTGSGSCGAHQDKCLYGIGTGDEAISRDKFEGAITKASALGYAGIMVDFEKVEGFSDVVRDVRDLLQKAHEKFEKPLKVGVTTGGSGYTGELCKSLGDPTSCPDLLHDIFQLDWDIWMPQMYSSRMANNAYFGDDTTVKHIWGDFKGEIIPVAGVQSSTDFSYEKLEQVYSGGCTDFCPTTPAADKCDPGMKHSPGYEYFHSNGIKIDSFAGFPFIGDAC